MRVEELISVGKILLTMKGGDLLLQVTHTGQHGSLTQPVNLANLKEIAVLHVDLVNQCLELISDRRNLQCDSRHCHWPTCLLLVRTFNVTHETGDFFGWGFAGWIAMLLPSRVAGRTLGLRGPDLARPCFIRSGVEMTKLNNLSQPNYDSKWKPKFSFSI